METKHRVMFVFTQKDKLVQAITGFGNTLEEAINLSKRWHHGESWIEEPKNPATLTKPDQYSKAHFVEALRVR